MKIKGFAGKLMIGTAQFGSKYGVTNIGQTSLLEAKKILKLSQKNKIKYLDTAYTYGNVYDVLNKIDISSFEIGTKIPDELLILKNPLKKIEKFIIYTYKKLKISKIDYLLIHNPEKFSISKINNIFKILNSIKQKYNIRKIGLSLYEFEYLKLALKKFVPEVIQFPLNLFDQNFILKKNLKILNKFKIEKHARSIFLQGILLEDYSKHNAYFKKWEKIWKKYYNWIKYNDLDYLEANLSFATSKDVDKIIIGINRESQLRKILKSNYKTLNYPIFNTKNEKKLIKPNLWKI